MEIAFSECGTTSVQNEKGTQLHLHVVYMYVHVASVGCRTAAVGGKGESTSVCYHAPYLDCLAETGTLSVARCSLLHLRRGQGRQGGGWNKWEQEGGGGGGGSLKSRLQFSADGRASDKLFNKEKTPYISPPCLTSEGRPERNPSLRVDNVRRLEAVLELELGVHVFHRRHCGRAAAEQARSHQKPQHLLRPPPHFLRYRETKKENYKPTKSQEGSDNALGLEEIKISFS